MAVVFIAGGAAYRLAVAQLRPYLDQRVVLPVPLSHFPIRHAGWTGKDQPLRPEVEKVAGADDYLSRLYSHDQTGEWASLYVPYCGKPRNMLGHRPTVCYPAHGWIHDWTRKDTLALPDGRSIPCLVHRFHQLAPLQGEIVVLNYYILNGVVTNDEDQFAGVGWRLPNIEGNPAYYVAQVQVSSTSEAAVRRLAADTAARILDFLPDARGRVRAAESVSRVFSSPSSREPFGREPKPSASG
jgi:hypothetical protein